MTKQLFLSLALCLSLLGSINPVLAQADEKSREDILVKLQREGWKIVNEGVLQRELKPGKIESFVFGVPGFAWKVQNMRRQLQKLRAEFRAYPTPQLREAIANHRKAIANTERTLELARTREALGESGVLKEGCTTLSSSAQATAEAKTDIQGVWAEASADYSGDCDAQVYAIVFARTGVNGEPGPGSSDFDGPRSIAGGSVNVYAESNGGAPCESSAYSEVTIPGTYPPLAKYQEDNYECPSPLDVTVTADAPSTTIDLYNTDCITITWTADISGGVSPYSSTMYLNGASQGTGPTYSGTWCNAGTDSSITLNVSATATDSGDPARSKSASAPTIIIRSHPVIPPLNVTVTSDAPSTTIDLYNDDCMTTTWTTNISGGTPPYTTKMYVNNSLVSNRATFRATRCNDGTNSSQTYTVSSTVRDSGYPAQSTSASATITVRNHVKPLAVTVTSNAPSTIVDLYNSDCITITWTTNISGGTSPYTSTMYLSSASQGTRTTYSKSYCNAGTNNSLTASVSAAVTDSSSPVQSKSASAPTITIRSHTAVSSFTVAIIGPTQTERTCSDHIWTASVSGGTPPFTYQWTWDGEVEKDETGSTNTKKFCVTYGTHTMGLTVTDSANRSSSTSIQVVIDRW